jgi:membrane associated rhomboid family serine protease
MPPAATPAAHQQPWFLGAPVTKLVTVGLVVVHFLVHSQANKNKHQLREFSWYRLFTSKLFYGSTGELVLGTLALTMQLRRLEREFGSRKFFLFLSMTNLFAIVLEMTAMLTMEVTPIDYAGPYPWMGASLFMYSVYTPRLHPRFVSMLGFSFSEKSLYYFLCAYVVFYKGYSTVVPTLLGTAAAYIFVTLPFLDLPDAVVLPFERMFSVLVDEPPEIYAPLLQQRQRRDPRPAPPVPPASPPPSEEAIAQLTSMGFERQRVLEALQSSNNSVERAADRLLSGS